MSSINNVVSNLNIANINLEQTKIKPVLGETISADNKAYIAPKDTLFKRNITVQQGIVPTIKGALIGGSSAALVGKALATIAIKDSPEFFVPMSTFILAVPGALAGAAVANYTNSKVKGAIAGATIGGLLGATVLPFPKVVLVSAAIGAIGGGVGGLSSTFIAKSK